MSLVRWELMSAVSSWPGHLSSCTDAEYAEIARPYGYSGRERLYKSIAMRSSCPTCRLRASCLTRWCVKYCRALQLKNVGAGAAGTSCVWACTRDA